METDDNSELEMNDELRGMISGNFENTPDVEKGQETRELSRLVNLDETEKVREELPEHRFVVKEDSGKITLIIGDHIFRRRYVRGDLAMFTCTGCEKVSRNTPGRNKGKNDASCCPAVKIKEAVDEMYSKIKEDPTKKIPRLYQEVRAKATENLDFGERCALLDEWPTYRAVQSRLYTVPWTASRSRSETSTSWPNV